ncbi:MAG: hypothetical protein R2799_03965 [Crocinitomicaceae bacterium]
MKLKMMMLVAVFFVTTFVSAYSVPYYNKDSKTYTFKVKINGSTREITFNGSTTGTAHCPPTADIAEIESSCGWVKVKNGQKITIKDGCITVN